MVHAYLIRRGIMPARFDLDGPIALLTLNRPEVYNAINRELLKKLREHLQAIHERREIRVVIITGAGEKAFCSGADLKERRTMAEGEVREYIQMIRDTFTMIENLPQPVIAAINGIALGGGTELALSCDLRIMSEQGLMGLTETALGIIPGAGGTQRLPRLVGKGIAKDLIFTARKVGASEALRIGLVNRIADQDQLLSAAKEWALEIAQNAPIALAQAKWAINQGMEVNLNAGLELESMAYQVLIPTKDRIEGLRAFQEKRKPNYTGE
jgi:enoyl-CoA hydratase/carnithine racemase